MSGAAPHWSALAVTVVAATAPVFHIADPRITEASGIALGVRSPGVAYVQNDSGDSNRFFALDTRTGATAATVTVRGASNVDWEDLAVARDARGVADVWLADTGDNGGARAEVRIYRVREPRVARTDRGRVISTEPAAVWRLRYPDGPVDAEGLAVAPGGGAFLVTKSVLGRSTVYRVPSRPDARHVRLLQQVGTIALEPRGVANPFGIPGELAITGAAISPDGSVFAVRTYAEAYLWRVGAGGVPAALRGRPRLVRLPRQPQGEGIALPDDRHAWIDSEGRHTPVYAARLPALPRPVGPTRPAADRSSAPPSAFPSAPASNRSMPASARAGSRPARWPIAFGALGAAAVLALLVLLGWRLRSGSRATGR